jgi:Uma2 family endonuclease
MVANPKDVPRPFYTLDEYFALEHAGDARYEYWDGDIVGMSGGSQAHYQISVNVVSRLVQKLSGGPCRAFTGDLPVKTPTLPPYRYPDVTVGCGELKFENIRGVDALINPVLILEVLSPTSEDRDREVKFTAYQAILTFEEYLLVAQNTPHVTHYAREADGKWLREDLTDLSSSVPLASVGCALSLSEIYEDVTFKTV